MQTNNIEQLTVQCQFRFKALHFNLTKRHQCL